MLYLMYTHVALEVLNLLELQELNNQEEQRLNVLASADCDSESLYDDSIRENIDSEGEHIDQ